MILNGCLSDVGGEIGRVVYCLFGGGIRVFHNFEFYTVFVDFDLD